MATRPEPPAPRTQAFLDAAFARRRAARPGAAEAGRFPAPGALRFGIDLGTATLVIAAVDAQGRPAYWDERRAQVVRDGVVVDFHGAVAAVRELAAGARAALGVAVDAAATAHPPAVPAAEARACAFVLQQAGIECRRLVDEVSAANAVLGVRDGAVVDVGGGSTGVGVWRAGERVRLADVAGGGHHLDLILAGALGLAIEAAEQRKRLHGAELLTILRPGVERIAESIRRLCGGVDPGVVHLAGGALQLPGADAVVADYLGSPVRAWRHAELITPFGIALG